MTHPTFRARRHPRGGIPIGGLALLVVVAIVLVLLFMNNGNSKSYVENISDARDKGREMDVTLDTRSIVQLVVAYQIQNDRYPASFAELEQVPPRDPWGTELTFTIDQAARPPEVVVTSAGPDAEMGTADDIVRRESLPG